MKIFKIESSNECGGFRPPKGHLDTQLYPECKGFPTDRDIVKKTTDKRRNKKRKKKASMDNFAKHSWPFMRERECQNKGFYDLYMNGEIGPKEFVNKVMLAQKQKYPGLTLDPTVRRVIDVAIENYKHDGDYDSAARSMSAAMTAGIPLDESKIAEKIKMEKEKPLAAKFNLYRFMR